jgi:hypothetical protein
VALALGHREAVLKHWAMSYGAVDDVEACAVQAPREKVTGRKHIRSVLSLSLLLVCAAACLVVQQQRGLPALLEEDEAADSGEDGEKGGEEQQPQVAEKPWGVDFDIKYKRNLHQWQITNLVLHPPPPPPPPAKSPPMVMTKATFPFFELGALNKADAKVKEKLDDPDTDPAVKEALEAGMENSSGALESAVGCAEGSQPGSSVKTACPGMGSGKPQEVKRQWSMGFPPQVGAAAQAGAAFKRRGLTGGDVDRGQTD